MSDKTFDAVSLGIMWDRLVSLVDEIVSTLVRTSFSTIVNESYDLTCVVLDAEANSIAQGTFSVPVFIGSAPITLRHMLKRFPPETLKPGDVIITNDPWLGTGHLYDITMVRPVFRKGRIVAYTLSITHLPDIGGSGFGSSAVEVYHEGLRLPICKLYEAGRLNELIVEIIRTNVRVPEQVMGDVMANVACNEVGGRELLAFMDEYGLDDLTDLSRAIRGQSEAAMRAKIRELGQGTYRNQIQVEGFDGPCDYVVRIDVEGRQRRLRFHGHLGLRARRRQRALLLHQCDGAARHQVAAAADHPQQRRLDRADLGVRAAGVHPQCAASVRHRRPPRHGAFRDAAGLRRAGAGAARSRAGRLRHDEPHHLPGHAARRAAVLHPLLRRRRLRRAARPRRLVHAAASLQHGDGAGGGVGDADAHDDREQAAAARHGRPRTMARRPRPGGDPAQRHRPSRSPRSAWATAPCFPRAACSAAATGRCRVHAIDGKTVHAKGRNELAPGQRMRIVEAGGGGFGDPKARAPAAVAEDVAQGYVSAAAAREIYGWRG